MEMSALQDVGLNVRSAAGGTAYVNGLFAAAELDFARYEVIKDVVDECIDLSLNYRQSGHPGGSRSKVHLLVSLLLSEAMRWDIRHPWSRFADRFVLSAGHTVPSSMPRLLCSTKASERVTRKPGTGVMASLTTVAGR
jgi:hypothetical protein